MSERAAVDLFAGPGGWDEGARRAGFTLYGVELDDDACATREAAGHATLKADVSQLAPWPTRLLVGSPPCPTFSNAGSRHGVGLLELIVRCAQDLARGRDSRPHAIEEAYRALVPSVAAIERERATRRGLPYRHELVHRNAEAAAELSLLVVEPLRWALATRPRSIALEQVPAVLPIWQAFTLLLEPLGYSCWAGTLNAANYGVPQLRERAFLLCSLDAPALPPTPTHCRGGALTFDGELAPWVTMADALGWNEAHVVGFPRRNDLDDGGQRDLREAREPAKVVTEKARSWTVNTGRDWKPGGTREDAQTFDAGEQPAPTIDDGKGRWHLLPGLSDSQPNRRPYGLDEPAPTVAFGHDSAGWVWDRPATTVMGDPRIAQPGHKRERTTPGAPGRSEDAIRVELHEAAILQGFRPDYPFAGSRSSRFRQVGNAVPPPLAAAILATMVPR